MSMPTQGYATSGPQEALKPFSFERRDPGAHDVLIKIHYCGICHSDIHQARNEWGNANYPMVPGHEIVGEVQAIGDQVSRFKVGDQVGVGCFVDSCRECPACREGVEQYCEPGMILTYNGFEKDGKTLTFGGYSQQIVVDENYVLKMPENLPMDAAAPLLCAGITTYSPLKTWGAGPGKKVAIMGLGGLGHVAVQIAKAMGAEVSVISHSDKKREDAKVFGAEHFYSSAEPDFFENKANSFDLIINTVSADVDLNPYINLLKRDGVMVILGIAPNPTALPTMGLVMKRRRLAGSLIGGIKETQEMLDFCAQHGIKPQIEKIKMEQVNEAYERMMKGDVRYRFVIDVTAFA